MPIDIPYNSGFGLAGWDWQAQRNRDLEERNRATAKFPLEQERRRFELDRDRELFDTGRPERTFANLMGQHKVQNVDQYRKLHDAELTNALAATNIANMDMKLQQGIQKIAMFADAINPKSMQNQNLAQNPTRIAEIEKIAKEFKVDLSAFGTPGSKQWNERAAQLVNEAKTMIFNMGIGQSKNFQAVGTQEAIKAQGDISERLQKTGHANALERDALQHDYRIALEGAAQANRMELARFNAEVQKAITKLQKGEGKQSLQRDLYEAEMQGDDEKVFALFSVLNADEEPVQVYEKTPGSKEYTVRTITKAEANYNAYLARKLAGRNKGGGESEPASRPTVSPAYRKVYDGMVGRGWVEGQQFFVHPDGSVTVNENNSTVKADQEFNNRGTARKPRLGTESDYTDAGAPLRMKGTSTQGGAALIPQSSGRR